MVTFKQHRQQKQWDLTLCIKRYLKHYWFKFVENKTEEKKKKNLGQNCFLYCLCLKTKAVLSFHIARRGSQLLTQPKWNNLQKPSAKQLTVEDSCWRALLLLMVCSCFPCGTLWNAYYQCLGSPVSYSALLPGRAMFSHYLRLCRSKALLIRWLPASCTSPWSRGGGGHRHVSHNDSSDSSTCQAKKPFKASVWGETIKCEEGSLTLWNNNPQQISPAAHACHRQSDWQT